MNGVDRGFRDPIFKFSNKKKQIIDDTKFYVPEEIFSRYFKSCTFKGFTRRIYGTKSYHDELMTNVQVSGGMDVFFASASFSAST